MRRIALLLCLCIGCQTAKPQLEATVDMKYEDGRSTPRFTVKVNLVDEHKGS